ncbi:MAG: heme exporter protein CcmB [Bryobacterales bacterium]|nr:heme exporter protein CcmB [Bryobacterales bacterium]
MLYLRQVWTVAGKDLRSELRTKESLNAAISFAIVILVLFSFAVDPSADQVKEISGGLLWLVFAFAGALILNRSFARELGNDCLDALVSSPVPGSALFLGKALGNFVLLTIVELVSLPIFGVLYNTQWARQPGMLMAILLLTTWGVTVIGTMFSALTVNLRLRELMLPTLIYPMMIPALMSAMRLTTLLIAGEPIPADDEIWIRLLIGFDIIFTALAVGLVEVVLVG